ncbi:MAG TPA: RluA family pseudouridine synthase [Acidobacteriota bacterium]|nr:RluA family pseudouridine synthase [Acidobacteriota bacterium]
MMSPDDPAGAIQHRHTVTEAEAGQRVDRFLADTLDDCSRTQIQRAAAAGTLYIDGRSAKPNHRLHTDEIIEITLTRPEPTDTPPQPEAIDLDVVYEDDHLIVINKPAGMVVHPAVGNWSGTLVNALLGRGVFAAGSPVGGGQRPGIVHRLDKGTSGLLVCARTESAHRKLAEQLKERTLSRIYRAVTWGRFKDDITEIEKPVGRSLSDRKKMAVTRRGRPAKTTVRVIERFILAELVEATLATGRTHQIRVHLTKIGHPVVGDSDYSGGAARLKGIYPERRPLGRAMLATIDRPALHAYTLSLDHPATGERMSWTVEPPGDFQALLTSCRTPAK